VLALVVTAPVVAASIVTAAPAAAAPAPAVTPAAGRSVGPQAAPLHLPGRPAESRASACRIPDQLAARNPKDRVGVTSCVVAGGTPQARDWLRRHRTSAEVLPLPDWCLTPEHTFNGWWLVRKEACMTNTVIVQLIDLQTFNTVGVVVLMETNYAYTGIGATPNWAYQYQLRPLTTWGFTAGTTVTGEATCGGACIANGSMPPQVLQLDVSVSAVANITTTVSAPGTWGFANATWSFVAANPVAMIPSEPHTATSPWARCDNMFGNRGIGCVFPEYPPVWQVSRSGPNPEFARHLADAQGSGLPGGYPAGPQLIKLDDPVKVKANGDAACPQTSALPRPAGFSCDEYPFRSTRQGAASGTGPGRTFPWCQITLFGPGSGPGGWSSCMIPAGQNSSGGGFLVGFYGSERVIDSDAFYVWVTP
jgi:hypothetical protein